LYLWSSKPIENVFTGRDDSDCISATTVLESMPPERKAPTGTSESIWSRTASVSRFSSSSTASMSLPAKRGAASGSWSDQ
jgi:hypothetical protein